MRSIRTIPQATSGAPTDIVWRAPRRIWYIRVKRTFRMGKVMQREGFAKADADAVDLHIAFFPLRGANGLIIIFK